MRVLDVGGTPPAWRVAPVQPGHVTTVNLATFDSEEPWLHHVVGDACDLPSELRAERFDLVFSNSLVEHVGGHIQRQRFADNVHAGADFHWVQTPYRYFPIEPHWLFPGMQWLPYPARVSVSRRWHFGHIQTATMNTARERVNEVDLLGVAQMRGYFPDSLIWKERFLSLPTSRVAVRD